MGKALQRTWRQLRMTTKKWDKRCSQKDGRNWSPFELRLFEIAKPCVSNTSMEKLPINWQCWANWQSSTTTTQNRQQSGQQTGWDQKSWITRQHDVASWLSCLKVGSTRILGSSLTGEAVMMIVGSLARLNHIDQKLNQKIRHFVEGKKENKIVISNR